MPFYKIYDKGEFKGIKQANIRLADHDRTQYVEIIQTGVIDQWVIDIEGYWLAFFQRPFNSDSPDRKTEIGRPYRNFITGPFSTFTELQHFCSMDVFFLELMKNTMVSMIPRNDLRRIAKKVGLPIIMSQLYDDVVGDQWPNG